ncbi:MAG: response regulator [Candidatus Sulfobium sp.]|jgi:CheY-like chemotaxis protein
MKKILIVDDVHAFIEKEKSILNRSDFTIFTTTSSREALELHRSEKMDLIVMDLEMPELNGDELCSQIRRDPVLQQVSVIIVGTNSDSDMNRFKRCQANAYITKPIRPLQLLEKVSQLLDIPERKSYRVLLKVSVNGKSPGETFFCSSQNISTSGILIETDKKLEKGDSISCSFFLPGAERITADAEVMRVAANGTDAYHYGVRFLDLKSHHRASIDSFIKSKSAKT